MGRPKVHLRVKHDRTACGNPVVVVERYRYGVVVRVESLSTTKDPDGVTCWSCKGTLAMADAEARAAAERRQRGSKRRRFGKAGRR